ncbi:MAG TPA: molybdate ABC transporter substrate-binding protein [Usitatibacter sp.]|nr:molybdate ABC transporter substrate-binding protein [Usitatibacter sp.]
MAAARRSGMPGRVAGCLLAALLLAAPAAHAATFLVFAAASLKESLDEVAAAFRASSGDEARIAYGASSALARQLVAGAPAQVFLSADLDWIAYVEQRGLAAGPPVALLSNDLVLIAPASSDARVKVAPRFDLARALGDGRLAVADPRAVPAGKYARAALAKLGAWEQVKGRLAPVADVRAALALVARGEAPLGIVYRTDALAEPRVRIVDAFPASSHPPIVYGMVGIRGASAAARAFAAYAASAAARAIWARHGFGTP